MTIQETRSTRRRDELPALSSTKTTPIATPAIGEHTAFQKTLEFLDDTFQIRATIGPVVKLFQRASLLQGRIHVIPYEKPTAFPLLSCTHSDPETGLTPNVCVTENVDSICTLTVVPEDIQVTIDGKTIPVEPYPHPEPKVYESICPDFGEEGIYKDYPMPDGQSGTHSTAQSGITELTQQDRSIADCFGIPNEDGTAIKTQKWHSLDSHSTNQVEHDFIVQKEEAHVYLQGAFPDGGGFSDPLRLDSNNLAYLVLSSSGEFHFLHQNISAQTFTLTEIPIENDTKPIETIYPEFFEGKLQLSVKRTLELKSPVSETVYEYGQTHQIVTFDLQDASNPELLSVAEIPQALILQEGELAPDGKPWENYLPYTQMLLRPAVYDDQIWIVATPAIAAGKFKGELPQFEQDEIDPNGRSTLLRFDLATGERLEDVQLDAALGFTGVYGYHRESRRVYFNHYFDSEFIYSIPLDDPQNVEVQTLDGWMDPSSVDISEDATRIIMEYDFDPETYGFRQSQSYELQDGHYVPVDEIHRPEVAVQHAFRYQEWEAGDVRVREPDILLDDRGNSLNGLKSGWMVFMGFDHDLIVVNALHKKAFQLFLKTEEEACFNFFAGEIDFGGGPERLFRFSCKLEQGPVLLSGSKLLAGLGTTIQSFDLPEEFRGALQRPRQSLEVPVVDGSRKMMVPRSKKKPQEEKLGLRLNTTIEK